jgi:restriction system protein
MLARDGFEVTLTPIARDGGKDIYAAKKDQLGAFLYIVECKKYAPDRPVGVSFVRSLHGVVQAENATAGVLVTTSRFTKPAQEFQERVRYQLSLRDYHDVARWLRTALP